MTENELYIRNAAFYETKYGRRSAFKVEGRPHHSITLRVDGKITVKSHGKKLISDKGSITFIPKEAAYTSEVLEDVHIIVIHFDTDGEGLPTESTVIAPEEHSLSPLFYSLTKTATHIKKMAILYEIISELARLSHNEKRSAIPKKIKKAREIIEESAGDPYFSVEGLAEELSVSASFLRREYRTAYGTSPIRYLKELRLTRAKELLLTDEHTVREIAALCGYTGISYFIQDFHKFVGTSPSKYRRQMWQTP